MIQATLFDKPLPFGGQLDVVIDTPRLTKHLLKVKEIMSDGRWHTAAEVARTVGCAETGASARIRDLRKPWAGGHNIEKRRVAPDSGLYEYRLRD